MKKIVPFNNVLTFNTDVCEITAISLEHDIKKELDTISGIFYISGEYKITDGQLERDKFNFELPFDIALSNNYNLDTLVVDIDDFRYELLDRNKLKVNIDLYIDGEILPEPVNIEETSHIDDEPLFSDKELKQLKEDDEESGSREVLEEDKEKPQEKSSQTKEESSEEEKLTETKEEKRIDLLNEMLENNKEEEMNETIDNKSDSNENNNLNIFNSFNDEEKYVTYRVYPVGINDTLDKILEKYNITKEELAKYNNLEDIKTGDKLIIPANDK